MLSVPAAYAQKDKVQDKDDQELQHIIITRKGNPNDKTVIEIKGDKVTINGKDPKNTQDVTVNVNKVKDYHALAKAWTPKGQTWNFNMDDDAISLFQEDENRAMLGVVTDEHDKGAEISSVSKESAAEKAGLKAGDVITRIGDKKIEDPDDVSEAIHAHKPGDKVPITVLRNGKEQKLTAELGKWKGVPMPPMTFGPNEFPRIEAGPEGGNIYYLHDRPRLGLSIQDTEEGKGVKVTDVDDEGSAGKAGFKEDDVITKVDGQVVNSTDEVSRQVRAHKDNTPIRMEVLRGGKPQTIEVRIPRKLKTADL